MIPLLQLERNKKEHAQTNLFATLKTIMQKILNPIVYIILKIYRKDKKKKLVKLKNNNLLNFLENSLKINIISCQKTNDKALQRKRNIY
jgi:hypothetical protein